MSVKLNPQQQQVVDHLHGPVQVIAAAGSGKTATLCSRIVSLLQNGVRMDNILAVTFTNKAAKEILERVRSYTQDDKLKAFWSGTFHSICCKILRSDVEALNLHTKNFSIVDDAERTKLIKALTKSLGLEKEACDGFKERLSWIKNQRTDYSLAQEDPNLVQFSKLYEAKLIESNLMDFDSLVYNTVLLFRKFPEIAKKYCRLWEYMFIDEFQDTNPIQMELLELVTDGKSNLMVIGDDAQSLYSWRGADLKLFLNFQANYSAKVMKMEVNYRSSSKIIQLANNLIKYNVNQLDKTVIPHKNYGEEVIFMHSYNDIEEADKVARHIKTLVDYAGIEYKDIAILYRLNNLAGTIESQLLKSKFPYKMYKGHKFYDRKEIRDCMCYLKFLGNQKDSISLERILSLEKGIGKTLITKLNAQSEIEHLSLYEVLLKNLDNKKLLNLNAKLSSLIYALNQDLDLLGILSKVFEYFHVPSYYEKDEEAESRLINIMKFKELLKGYTKPDNASTFDFLRVYLEETSLMSEQDEGEDPNVIKLMSIHGSKGLEFKVVFIIGCSEFIMPHVRAVEDDSLEEERRLMYVAVTRAKDLLFVSSIDKFTLYGKTIETEPSRFIEEMKNG